MGKTTRGFQKVQGGLRWTRRGFVKMPDQLRPVSIKSQPLKERPTAKAAVKAKAKPTPRRKLRPPTSRTAQAQAELEALRQDDADTGCFLEREELYQLPATTLAGEAAKRIGGQQRKAWLGKYDGLKEND